MITGMSAGEMTMIECKSLHPLHGKKIPYNLYKKAYKKPYHLFKRNQYKNPAKIHTLQKSPDKLKKKKFCHECLRLQT